MTPSAPPPQDLVAAGFQGWGQVTMAWLGAAERWWATILEWAYDECAYTGINQTTAYANVDATTPLRGEFYRATDPTKALIPPSSVTIGRTTDAVLAKAAAPNTNANAVAAAGGPPLLVITIRPGPAAPPGGYRGAVVNASTGALVADFLYILVATVS